MSQLLSIWDYRTVFPSVDGHLWTIQAEFFAFPLLYVALLMFARTRVYVRPAALLILSAYAFAWGRWTVMMYF